MICCFSFKLNYWPSGEGGDDEVVVIVMMMMMVLMLMGGGNDDDDGGGDEVMMMKVIAFQPKMPSYKLYFVCGLHRSEIMISKKRAKYRLTFFF